MAEGGGADNTVHSLINDVPGLTEEEKSQLLTVMMKAKEFDAEEENKMRKPLEGQLNKYTNVVKGWQYRWFVLTPETGMLEYYMMDEIKKHRPRGALHLAGAVISPSEEDSQTFTVSAPCSEVYKLRASNAKERQFWVNRLRVTAEHHSHNVTEKVPISRDTWNASSSQTNLIHSLHSQDTPSLSPEIQVPNKTVWYPPGRECTNAESSVTAASSPSLADSLSSIKGSLEQSILQLKSLVKIIEDLPCNGPHIKSSDAALLLLKATSQATVQCLEQCFIILHQQHLAASFPSGLPPGATVEWVDSYKPVNVSLVKKSPDPVPKSPSSQVSISSSPCNKPTNS